MQRVSYSLKKGHTVHSKSLYVPFRTCVSFVFVAMFMIYIYTYVYIYIWQRVIKGSVLGSRKIMAVGKTECSDSFIFLHEPDWVSQSGNAEDQVEKQPSADLVKSLKINCSHCFHCFWMKLLEIDTPSADFVKQ